MFLDPSPDVADDIPPEKPDDPAMFISIRIPEMTSASRDTPSSESRDLIQAHPVASLPSAILYRNWDCPKYFLQFNGDKTYGIKNRNRIEKSDEGALSGPDDVIKSERERILESIVTMFIIYLEELDEYKEYLSSHFCDKITCETDIACDE